jgi:hypothetical protein
MNLDTVAKTVQVVSVVAGVVISVLSFNATRQKDLESREKEIRAQEMQAAKPFLELRQSLYREALKCAAILSNPEHRKPTELDAARRRFRELYVAELSMVEDPEVEVKMVALARQIDPQLLDMTEAQQAAYSLAHALRDTFAAEWGITNRQGNRRK